MVLTADTDIGIVDATREFPDETTGASRLSDEEAEAVLDAYGKAIHF